MLTTDYLACPGCTTKVNEQDSFCEYCGFPLKATEKEQNLYRLKKAADKIDSDLAIKKIKEARNILFIIAALTLIFGIVMYFSTNSLDLLITNLILSIIYCGLGFWATSKPFPATLTALLIYIGIILLNAFIDPNTIYQGILFKIIFTIALVKASYGAYKFKIKKI